MGKMRIDCRFAEHSVGKYRPYVDTDRTLTRTTTLTETLTLTITITLTLFSHSVIHRQHFTGGRYHWVKRLVREVAGSNLNGRHFVIYLF